MDIAESIAWLEGHIHVDAWAARSARVGDVELSLERMQRFVATLGDPQHAAPVIHITGTNGKGSTGRMIARLLMGEGLRVGSFSSPHLQAYNERFRIDDVDISDDALAALLSAIADAETAFGEQLTPFELLTAAAFVWFRDQAVDVIVLEVGLLGRFDATNVAHGAVAVVTNIGFDHTSGEGDWALRIAQEKAGIVEAGAHLVLGAVDDRLAEVFTAEGPADTVRLDAELTIDSDVKQPPDRRVAITTPWQTLTELPLRMQGPHQAQNLAVALGAASAFLQRPLDADAARAAIAAVRMPGRLERVQDRPIVILDGAHNPDAARALWTAVSRTMTFGTRTLVIGLLRGRDPATMLRELHAQRFDHVVVTTAPTSRALPAAELADAAAELGVTVDVHEDLATGVQAAMDRADRMGVIIVTGSMYLVGAARAMFGNRIPAD